MSEMITKTLEEHFCSWESSAFGFGYGTGEPYVIPALRTFLENCPQSGCYYHDRLEQAVTPTVAWLLINRLCREDILEYGTSPRFAWLTKGGNALRSFMLSRTADRLVEILTDQSENDRVSICARDACNCGPRGYHKDLVCPNPFWGRG